MIDDYLCRRKRWNGDSGKVASLETEMPRAREPTLRLILKLILAVLVRGWGVGGSRLPLNSSQQQRYKNTVSLVPNPLTPPKEHCCHNWDSTLSAVPTENVTSPTSIGSDVVADGRPDDVDVSVKCVHAA